MALAFVLTTMCVNATAESVTGVVERSESGSETFYRLYDPGMQFLVGCGDDSMLSEDVRSYLANNVGKRAEIEGAVIDSPIWGFCIDAPELPGTKQKTAQASSTSLLPKENMFLAVAGDAKDWSKEHYSKLLKFARGERVRGVNPGFGYGDFIYDHIRGAMELLDVVADSKQMTPSDMRQKMEAGDFMGIYAFIEAKRLADESGISDRTSKSNIRKIEKFMARLGEIYSSAAKKLTVPMEKADTRSLESLVYTFKAIGPYKDAFAKATQAEDLLSQRMAYERDQFDTVYAAISSSAQGDWVKGVGGIRWNAIGDISNAFKVTEVADWGGRTYVGDKGAIYFKTNNDNMYLFMLKRNAMNQEAYDRLSQLHTSGARHGGVSLVVDDATIIVINDVNFERKLIDEAAYAIRNNPMSDRGLVLFQDKPSEPEMYPLNNDMSSVAFAYRKLCVSVDGELSYSVSLSKDGKSPREYEYILSAEDTQELIRLLGSAISLADEARKMKMVSSKDLAEFNGVHVSFSSTAGGQESTFGFHAKDRVSFFSKKIWHGYWFDVGPKVSETTGLSYMIKAAPEVIKARMEQ
ncbi:hypothetical protein [Desulfovibrio oxyclinae]|uniref:hypothetical protein n=1 Tax=Desulfovibrio oxyclinae TaxID=63560 RepID=UPI000370D393|nr:hypothetical protein [Desulfovibrio oxyclinae]